MLGILLCDRQCLVYTTLSHNLFVALVQVSWWDCLSQQWGRLLHLDFCHFWRSYSLEGRFGCL